MPHAARLRRGALLVALAGTGFGVGGVSAAERPAARAPVLANRCLVMQSAADGASVSVAGSGYRTAGRAARFFVKPTGPGTVLLYDQGARLVGVRRGRVLRLPTPGPAAEWAVRLIPARGLQWSFAATATGRREALAVKHGVLALARAAGSRAPIAFRLLPARGCTPFPEAQVGATGSPFTGTRHGRVFGFVDDHVHITGNMRSGGDVISGEPFDRFGITLALGQDVKIHGPGGSLDITGDLLRTGLPVGSHDTHGWPTFAGWPTYNTMTHQQVYYVWLERAWIAGERLVVAQTADDEPMCRIEPRRRTRTCDETASVKAQIRTLKQLKAYIDAQSGGAGRGFFQLVYSPAQARRVIARGKLAVVIGIESSDLFGCSERGGRPQCTRADINRGLREYKRLGVRSMFVAHWINNAFAGAALEGGAKGVFINIMNRFQTGSYFKTGPCPGPGQGVTVTSLSQSTLSLLAGFFPAAKQLAKQGMPSYPPGKQCNARGLTGLGRYLIRRMMAAHMMIEVDHLSERARDTVLTMAARAHYPLISSHNGTGGEWTPAELVRLYRLGGFAAVTPDDAPVLAQKILRMARFKSRTHFFAVGLGTDTNGFSSLPAPRTDARQDPLRYPFKSYDGRVTFVRERTGRRTFDLNTDGVAHYGLVADLLADMGRTRAGRRALALLFNSAEAYLETWERAVNHRGP